MVTLTRHVDSKNVCCTSGDTILVSREHKNNNWVHVYSRKSWKHKFELRTLGIVRRWESNINLLWFRWYDHIFVISILAVEFKRHFRINKCDRIQFNWHTTWNWSFEFQWHFSSNNKMFHLMLTWRFFLQMHWHET